MLSDEFLEMSNKRNDNDDDLVTRKKKKRSIIYYDDEESPCLLQKGKGKQQQQQLGRKQRTSLSLSKCSKGFEKQEGSKQMDIFDTGFENQVGSHDIFFKPLQNGDTLNISDILFTEDRDFLVTYNDRDRPVQAKHLEGKVIVLHFVPLVSWSNTVERHIISLVDTYNDMHPDTAFEVVFIGIKIGKYASKPKKLHKSFEQKFSLMPWPAIPFSDIKPPEYFAPKLRFQSSWMGESSTVSVVVDPTGVVLQCLADDFFLSHGAEAYPFTDQRIGFLASQDREALNHPSVTTLLTSPERDYLINNKYQAVPVHTLEDKVIGLYFYQEKPLEDFTLLKRAYEQLAKVENFDIVLIYIPNTYMSCENNSENSFWFTFRTMPWLALPFKDSKWMTLKRIFKLPEETLATPDPRLVIVGPQGKFIEPYGSDILLKYGISAYPFTRQRVAQLEAKYLQELKLDMFWDPNTSFIRKNGPKVKLSQLVGKRIIVVLESDYFPTSKKFWGKLKARYLRMKETNNEFEVIYIFQNQGSSDGEHVVGDMSWLIRHPPICRGSNLSNLLLELFGPLGGLLAFDSSGRVVRKTRSPSIERGNMDFPFHAGSLEEDALRYLVKDLEWDLFWKD